MRRRKIFFSLILLLLALLAIGTFRKVTSSKIPKNSPIKAKTEKNVKTYDGQEKQITSLTNTPIGLGNLDIDGDKIVWLEYGKNYSLLNLYFYDLSTSQKKLISSSQTPKKNVHIRGQKIIWEEFTGALQGQIYLHDLETGKTRLLSQENCPCVNPVIDGNLVAWAQDHYSSILISNLATGKKKIIPIGSVFAPSYPQIGFSGRMALSGHKLAWISPGQENESDLNERVWLYDFETEEKRQISQGKTSAPESLSLDGDKIVWADKKQGNLDIYLYDLSKNEEKQITTDNKTQRNPSVSGNFIVFEDFRQDPAKSDLSLYDIGKDQERTIISQSALQLAPKISGQKMIWLDNRNNPAQKTKNDIFLLSL